MPDAPHRDPSVGADSFRTRWPIGDLLARVIVPLWVTAGAFMKLAERDPRLLPSPILDLVGWASTGFMTERNAAWLLDSTMRTLIGIELILVVGMVLAPRLSRLLATFTLTVFLILLAEMMRRDVVSSGFVAMLKGDCGCLGAKSPPAPIMFLIDAVLLAGVLIFPLTCALGAKSTRLVPLGLIAGSIGAITLSTMTPPKARSFVLPPDVEVSPSTGYWPAAPEPSPMYFPQAGTWVGRPMSEIDLLQQMQPAPAEHLLSGISYLVVYRGDCGNCHDLLATHMSGERAERTIALRVAEGDPAKDKEMPSDRFHLHDLPEGPDYVMTAPLLVVARDGVVRAASTGVDLETAKAMLSSVEDEQTSPPPPTPSTTPGTDPSTDPSTTDPAPTPVVEPPAARGPGAAWPPRPTVIEDLYFPQFADWIGRRLDEQPLALHINRPMPVNVGVWHLIFYRADCDQCHEMMDLYLVGPAEQRVIAVRVPDTDPAGDLPMPLTQAHFRSLPEGPTYAFTSPVLMTIKDGVVLAIATDVNDDDSVMACLLAE